MTESQAVEYIAFHGAKCIGAGSPEQVARAAKQCVEAGGTEPLLVFDARTSQPLELDLRGSLDDVLGRLARATTSCEPSPSDVADDATPAVPRTGPGRPKLGVVAREVTLLPRHWEWLSGQPGGASVTLRRLVESARGAGAAGDRRRVAQESAYRFLSAMLGNQPGFEEAIRALFANDPVAYATHAATWPADLRAHAQRLADAAFAT